jgi:hypothetical protein
LWMLPPDDGRDGVSRRFPEAGSTLYNVSMAETKTVRLTETVKAAG